MSISTQITELNNNINDLKSIKQDIKKAINTDFNVITNEKLEDYADIIKNTFETYKDYIPFTETEQATEITVNDAMEYSKNKIKLFGNTEQRILPFGYTQLDYIESTGTQRIFTEIQGDCSWELKAQSTTISSSSQILIGRSVEVANWFGANNEKWGSGGIGNTSIGETTLADIVVNFNGTTISGTVNNESFERVGSTAMLSTTFTLCGRESYGFAGKLYKAKCIKNNVVVRDFIPCKNPDNEVGLYDLVSQSFFANSTTGNFVAGDVTEIVPTPTNEIPIHNVNGNNTITITNSDNTKSQTLSFTLAEGQEMYEGDYLADDGIHHVDDVDLITANKYNWQLRSDVESENYVTFRQLGYTTNKYTKLEKSNYFKVVSTTDNDSNNIRLINSTNYGIQITINKNIASTREELDSWLTTHSLEVVYKRATERIESYTETQQQQYNALKKILTYYPQTNITVQSADSKPIMTLSYKKIEDNE